MASHLHLSLNSLRPRTFAYLFVFALLAFAAFRTAGAQMQQRLGSSSMASASAGKTITVWKVGSPFGGDIPDTTIPAGLELSAEGLGYKLSIESFPARGFAETFLDAFEENREPDILVIDNYGIIRGITTPLGNFKGIGSSEKVRQGLAKVSESLTGLEGPKGGWEFLMQTSKNYEAAKSLALRSPRCNANWQNQPLTEDLKAVAVRTGPAFVEGAVSLESFEDAEQLHVEKAEEVHLKVSETRECGYWGNDRLAFVPLGPQL